MIRKLRDFGNNNPRNSCLRVENILFTGSQISLSLFSPKPCKFIFALRLIQQYRARAAIERVFHVLHRAYFISRRGRFYVLFIFFLCFGPGISFRLFFGYWLLLCRRNNRFFLIADVLNKSRKHFGKKGLLLVLKSSIIFHA